MKNIIKILFCFWLIFLATVFLLRVIKPNFNSWQYMKGIFFESQVLPLAKMYPFSHQGDNYPVKEGQTGFVVSGVPVTLPGGDWQFNLEILSDCQNSQIGTMDIVRKEGHVSYGSKIIIVGRKGQKQIESLDFTGKTGSNYEFRLNTNGSCGFEIKRAWLKRERLNLP